MTNRLAIIHPVRRAVLGQIDPTLAATYAVTWNNWTVPVWLELTIVAAIG